jgi:transcriptional regulator with XRE-family HTH domain
LTARIIIRAFFFLTCAESAHRLAFNGAELAQRKIDEGNDMHVYVIERPDGLVKIGKSQDPEKRISAIECQGGFKTTKKWFSEPVDDYSFIENSAHVGLASFRKIGEWFSCSFVYAVDHVNTIINSGAKRSIKDWNIRIKQLRIKKGLSQHNLAELCNVNRVSVTLWETGSSKAIDGKNLLMAADALGVSPYYIMFGFSLEEQASDIIKNLTKPQRAQALRMLEAFAASCAQEHAEI